MDDYIVSARKYRPATFSTVVGQTGLTTTLKNAIANGKLAHAYLFCGPRGVGKTTCARIFAKTINCMHLTNEHEACNKCESCLAFNEQRSYNIHELDAASNNSVEDIRALIEQVRIPPQIGRYKVYIIDEVHMLSSNAFNAFLKTLEEPPAYAIFILATTEKYKILPTILSRCQVYDFNRITVQDIAMHLSHVASLEAIHSEPEALNVIAQKADGGMRDALSMFDQLTSYTQGNITYKNVIESLHILDYDYYFRFTALFLTGAVKEAVLLLNEVLQQGFEAHYFIGGLGEHFRTLLMAHDVVTLQLLEVSDNVRERYVEQSKQCSDSFLYRALEICTDCDIKYKQSRNKRLLVELALIRLCQLQDEKKKVTEAIAPIQPVFSSPVSQKNVTPQAPTSTPVQVVASKVPPVEKQAMPVYAKPTVAKQKLPETTGFTIRRTMDALGGKSDDRQAKEKIEEVVQKRASDYSEEDLKRVWEMFIAENEQEHHLVSIMKEHFPIKGANHCLTVVLYSQIDEKKMQESHHLLSDYLREKLGNDYIVLETRLEEPDESHKVYTQKEKLEMMLQKNHHLYKLCDLYQLKLN